MASRSSSFVSAEGAEDVIGGVSGVSGTDVCDICDIDNTEGRASRVCQIQECCTRTQKPTAANMTGHVEREMAESSQVNEEKCVEKGYEGKELAD